MAKAGLYNITGKKVGDFDLNDAIFGIEPNVAVMHAAVKNHLANCRQGTQSALTRAEVSGGGKKPWRQKGTGRARQGSTRAPQWTHGGIAFAPKPRDYSYAINKKAKRLALLSALSAKAGEEEIYVVDELKLDEIKTKSIVKMLEGMEVANALLVTAESDNVIYRSARNIEGVKVIPLNNISTYDLIKYDSLVISKDAVAKLEEVYA
ncbi:MAG: 50S ribosomal protein L4 [Clostridia bacterium]|nr:50S ribosomal protein L4 [Clostridia bacterium]MBR4439765.1 50S ribosomal protein L4 [Clostridia bacterium]MBR5768734.1 50S ribosomal protein L4 [Clostridia bacterium]MBR5943028.1 50S ribosomal protein L4 [Clostridia bacterium]